MKTNMINSNSIKTYICAIVLMLGMSVSAWGATAIPSGYELVDALSDLSTGDYVVLYNTTTGNGISGIGNCVNGDYVSAYEATLSSTEGMWIQYYVTKGVSSFTLKDKAANKFVVNESKSFRYGNSGSDFTINGSGALQNDSKQLQGTNVYTGDCERASARWGTSGSIYAVYKVSSSKVKDGSGQYTVTPSTMTLSADMEDDIDKNDYVVYSNDFTVTFKYAFGGAIYAELLVDGDDYSYANTPGLDGYIGNHSANNSQTTETFNIAISPYTPNGSYSGYVHVYPSGAGKTTDIEYYIPITYTVTNSWNVGCTAHNILLDDDGSVTGGSFSTSSTSECEGETITITATPSTGYVPDSWIVYDNSLNELSLSGSGNTRTFTMPDEEVLVSVTFTNQYTVNLDREGGTTGATSITTTYNSSTVTGFTAPTKEGYTFGGYYTGDNGTGTLVLSTGGVLQASVTGYTGAGGVWTKTTATTLYANWTVNSHKLSVASDIANVTVTATPSGESAIAEGSYNASVNYGTSVALSASSITGGYAFNSWVVTKDADESDVTASVVDGNTLTMPDYDVTVSATMYAKAKLKTRCLQEPEFTVTGSVYLTSYANVEVYTTDNPDNRITITCADFESADRLYITYLNSSGDTIAKTSSPFRLCDASTYNKVDATYDYIDISAVNWSDGQKFCVSYKPGESEYNQTDTWTIRLTPRKGASTNLGHQDIVVHGRALPEKFVVAAPYNGQWYALPADMATSSGTVPTPYLIGVDNRETPTVATYANTKALFTGAGRYTAANKGGLRLKSTMTQINSNDAYLTAPNSASETYLWLATGASNFQDWYLTSSDFSSYTVQINPAVTNGRALRMNGGKIGYYTTGATEMYLLPVTNEITDLIDATVTEWGRHSVILAANPGAAATKAQARIEGGSPTEDQTITAINGVIGTAKNIKVPVGDLDLADLANNEGKLLYIDWYNGSTPLGTSMVTIPRIIAASRNMYKDGETTKGPWNTEVHVLPGVTLTANTASYSPSGATIKELHIYPGATLNVSTGTLTATTLRLHNGWTRAGDKKYDVARVYIADDAALTKTTASMDYDIYEQSDGKHYYPLAVPFATAVNTIDYVDPTLAAASKYRTHYVIKEYDGANRAINGEDSENNWDSVPAASTLVPGKGYIMTAVAVKGEAIIRVPLVFDNAWTADGELGTAHYSDADHTKNEVTVTAHAGAAATANKRHAGWNMLGVPYMSCFASKSNTTHSEGAGAFITGKMELTGNPANPYGGYNDDVPYVTVPTHDFSEYLQYDITDDDTKLLPGWSFFVQFAEGGTLTFANTGQTNSSSLPIYAPQRTMDSTMTRIKTGVILSTADGETSDKFGLIISDRYTQDYEVGADLEKMFGNGYTLATYSLSQGTRLAFNALSTAEAAQVIPVGYRAPEAGQYTFAINPRYATEGLLRVELIDYQTGDLTDLLTSTYTFTTSRTQDDTRFAIHVTYTDPNSEMPTGEAPPIDTGETLTRKFILNGQLYIQRGTVIYDATGKEVRL